MRIPKAQRDARQEAFARACAQAGVRRTPQREAIFQVVAGTDEHPDAETVHRRLRARLPHLSHDTVYRALALFEELGLIRKVGVASDRARFDPNAEAHHHFVCTACGAIQDVTDPALDRIRPPAAARQLGRVTSTQVEMRGICRRCQRKRDRKA